MEEETARDGALEFEGKSEAEIPDEPRPRLTARTLARWAVEQDAARQRDADARTDAASDNAEENADRNACDDIDEDDRRSLEAHAALDNLRERIARAQANLAAPAHPRKFPHVRVPHEHEALMRPAGDAAQLLEHQIASSAALMGYIAHFIARPDTDPEVCISFMDRMSSMLGANAQVGKVVGRLRGNISETRQTITVEKKVTGGGVGEGVLEL